MEFELIRQIQRKVGPPTSSVICGIGDDCAVLPGRPGMLNLITTDAVVEGRHFYRPFFTPQEIALKAVGTAVSDIAAMGGKPQFIVLSLGLPKKGASTFVKKFYDGMRSACRKWDVSVIGGNLTASKTLWISTTVIGEVARENCKFRSGARPGDAIYVTGPLGSAAMGLFLHQRRKKIPNTFARAQKTPAPSLTEGAFLGRFRGVTSMIDISDGLVADLSHILTASSVGAVVEWQRIPLHPQLESLARKNGFSIYDLVLSRGEDYELLFTVRANGEKDLLKKAAATNLRLFKIGRVTPSRNSLHVLDRERNRIKTSRKGYDHFDQGSR